MPAVPFLGNAVNAVAVVLGSLLGIALGRFVTGRLQEALMQATGLGCAFIGLSGTLAQMLSGTAGAAGTTGPVALQAQGSVLLIVSLIIGTVIGQAIDIEGKLELLGDWLRRTVAHPRPRPGSDQTARPSDGARFNEAFISGALIICPGAMAVMGGLEDGMGNPQTLLVKAALDFVIVFILASSLGVGTAFSALPLFVYQSVFVLIGMLVGNFMTDAMASGLSMVGNALIFAVGLNLLLRDVLGEHTIKAGNMIPAMLVPIVYYLIVGA
ncbi:MAG: DUF554 domain-containing protein [Coriobacteriia bacterium]|nr:DUF554 domain-containing protein [Coriobacteriia bacterium]